MSMNRRQFFTSAIGAAIAFALPWKKAHATGIDGAAMRERLRGIYSGFVKHVYPSQKPAKCILISPEAFEAVRGDIAVTERLTTMQPAEWSHALAFKDTHLVADARLSGMECSILPRDYAIDRATFKFWRNAQRKGSNVTRIIACEQDTSAQ